MNLAKCYDGSGRSASPLVPLDAGSLQLMFDPVTGWIWEVTLQETEIVQAIYPAIRGDDWATIPYKLTSLHFEEKDGDFVIKYLAETTDEKHPFQFRCTATGSDAGGLLVNFEGEAKAPFQSNRIGLCLLHPAKLCSGLEYKVKSGNGPWAQGEFPKEISANKVQSRIGGLTHEIAPGVPLEITFGGDLFEMEDQRNYSDDSFKTYTTAKGQAQPWQAAPGTKIQHSIQIKAPSGGASAGHVAQPFVTVDFTKPGDRKLPAVGIAAAGHGERLSDAAIERLKLAHLHHVRLDLRLGKVPIMAAFSMGARQAADIECKILLALHLTDSAGSELRSLRSLLDQIKPDIAAYIIFPPDGKQAGGRWIELTKTELGSYAPEAPILIGSSGGFLGLNRLGTDSELGDGLVFGASPTIHDESNHTVMTNLGGLGQVATNARGMAGQRPLFVSPLHLRFSGAASLRNEALGIPGDVDLRQGSLFAAAWTVGAMQQLIAGGVDGVTIFETTGWRGLMERQKGSQSPTRFPSTPGMVFPIYHLIRDLGGTAKSPVLPVTISQERRVAAFGVAVEDGLRIWVANLTPEPVLAMVTTESDNDFSWVRMLDEISYQTATNEPENYRSGSLSLLQKRNGAYPVALLPYGVARLDEADAEVETEE